MKKLDKVEMRQQQMETRPSNQIEPLHIKRFGQLSNEWIHKQKNTNKVECIHEEVLRLVIKQLTSHKTILLSFNLKLKNKFYQLQINTHSQKNYYATMVKENFRGKCWQPLDLTGALPFPSHYRSSLHCMPEQPDRDRTRHRFPRCK